MRVPLIAPTEVIIYRLAIQETWAEDPPGPATKGYDRILREPVLSRTAANVRQTPRQELAAVRVPCQVRVKTWEELSMHFGGDAPDSNIVFICHRMNLSSLGLIEAGTGRCLLKKGDRIAQLEKKGTGIVVQTFVKPLYVFKAEPRSWGMGPDGHDLELLYTMHRNRDVGG